MIDRGKLNILGVLVDAVDYEAAVEAVAAAAQAGRGLSVTALAVHGVMTGVQDANHRHRLNQLDIVCPDGQPVRWALNRLYGAALPDRVYGPTLMLKTCERAERDSLPIFLLGGDAEMLSALRQGLQERFPRLRIAGQRPSKFRALTRQERDELIAEVCASGARITFVGLGCPRQEVFVYECCEDLRMPCLAVGAAFAFHAGLLPQAPSWMQRSGLEWLFRLLQEPTRLWRRYLLLNPAYATLLCLQWCGWRQRTTDDTRPPSAECLYG